MRRAKSILSFCVFICMMMMFLPTHATEMRASEQIRSYGINVTSSSGEIDVQVTVRGIGTSSKLGCESIEVYEDTNGRWKEVESLDEFDEGMSDRNSRGYINTIYIDGEVGSYYKVIVTIFAEDENGRDAREETFYVTCRA